MSRKRRNFSAKFKSDLVIELLKGEKDLNTLATENNIQPNLLRNWKSVRAGKNRAAKSANKSESAGEWAENVGLWTKNFRIIPDTYGLW